MPTEEAFDAEFGVSRVTKAPRVGTGTEATLGPNRYGGGVGRPSTASVRSNRSRPLATRQARYAGSD